MSTHDEHANLDAISRRLQEAEAALDAALKEESANYTPSLPSERGVRTYEEMTAFHEDLRAASGWGPVDLEAALTPQLRRQLEATRTHQRIPWQLNDFATVGLASLIGALAALF